MLALLAADDDAGSAGRHGDLLLFTWEENVLWQKYVYFGVFSGFGIWDLGCRKRYLGSGNWKTLFGNPKYQLIMLSLVLLGRLLTELLRLIWKRKRDRFFYRMVGGRNLISFAGNDVLGANFLNLHVMPPGRLHEARRSQQRCGPPGPFVFFTAIINY